jgi:hypothetical protein
MFGSYRILARPMFLLIGGVGLCGCQFFQPQQPSTNYPVSPPKVDAGAGSGMGSAATVPTTTSTLVRVPADAVVLSSGAYPPPSFPAPTQPGLIEVVDLDGDPTVAVASSAVTGTGGDAAKQMSITDVTNLAVSLNKDHKYRIVFVPAKPGTPMP